MRLSQHSNTRPLSEHLTQLAKHSDPKAFAGTGFCLFGAMDGVSTRIHISQTEKMKNNKGYSLRVLFYFAVGFLAAGRPIGIHMGKAPFLMEPSRKMA